MGIFIIEVAVAVAVAASRTEPKTSRNNFSALDLAIAASAVGGGDLSTVQWTSSMLLYLQPFNANAN